MSEQGRASIPDAAPQERREHYERISGKAPRRGLTVHEAAEHCGMSVSGFLSWIKRAGIVCRFPGTTKYDLKKLDAELDRIMGLAKPDAPERELTPYEAWKAKRDGCAA
jgi:hypothetical protein